MHDVARVPGGPEPGRDRAGGFFAAVAGFAVRFRWLVVIGWLAVAVATMLALPGLGSEVNSDPSLFLPAAAPSVQAATLASPLLGSVTKSKVTIVAARASGPLTTADLAAVSQVAGLARQVGGVLGVRAGSISPDGHAAEIDVTVGHEASDVAWLKPVLRHLQAGLASADPPPGLQLHLAGPVASNAASNASGNKATGRIGLFAIVFIVVALLILLRSPVAALVTFLPSVAALLVSEKFIAGLGAHGLQISSVTETLLVVLLLGAGTDYGLFLIYRFREERRAGTEPQPAVVRALTRVGASITASAGTVVLALLTLLLATFGLYRDLAVPLALGIAVMLLAGLTLLPALLALTAGWMFQGDAGPGRGEQADWWGRVAARAVRLPGLLLGPACWSSPRWRWPRSATGRPTWPSPPPHRPGRTRRSATPWWPRTSRSPRPTQPT